MERLERLRARHEATVDEERRRGADADTRPGLKPLPHAIRVLARIEAGVERLRLEAQVRRVLLQRVDLQRPLVLEQPIVELPVLALVTRAVRRL